jgi:aminoglycoside phosphotransferase (APT) family kinase protein
MDAHLPGFGTGDLRLTSLSGGTSGSVLRVERADATAVLRATAWPPRPDSARSIEREAQVLRALDLTDVPHPGLLGFCADPTVIGSPFCLMAYVDGWLGAGKAPPPFDADRTLRHRTAFAMIDGLVALARVDPTSIGLGGFGKPDRFLERQVDRWTALMAQHRKHPDYGDRALPDFEAVGDWLRVNLPASQRTCLIHGDISMSNVMFRNDAPPRLAAIIDWEIATLGDPLLELGRTLYPFPSRTGIPGPSVAIDLSGYPSREALAKYYSERSGLDATRIGYYMVLAMFKLAALIEFNHVKSLRDAPGSMSHRLAAFVPTLLASARALAREYD